MSGLLGWRLVMALSSIVPAGVAVMAGLFMPNFGPYHHRSQPAGTGAASMPLCQQWSHMWRMVQLWVVAATGFCMNIAPMSFLGLWAVPFFKVPFPPPPCRSAVPAVRVCGSHTQLWG